MPKSIVEKQPNQAAVWTFQEAEAVGSSKVKQQATARLIALTAGSTVRLSALTAGPKICILLQSNKFIFYTTPSVEPS